jgi:hypothetical protein
MVFHYTGPKDEGNHVTAAPRELRLRETLFTPKLSTRFEKRGHISFRDHGHNRVLAMTDHELRGKGYQTFQGT